MKEHVFLSELESEEVVYLIFALILELCEGFRWANRCVVI